MKSVAVIGGYETIYTPVKYFPQRIGLAVSDIKEGMNLTNESNVPINVYDNPEGTGDPMVTVQPGEAIGLVLKIEVGSGGPAYRVHSDKISSSNIFSNVVDTIFSSILPESSLSYGYVLYKDLANPPVPPGANNDPLNQPIVNPAVSTAQVQQQQQTQKAADDSANWIPGVPNIVTVGGGLVVTAMVLPKILDLFKK